MTYNIDEKVVKVAKGLANSALDQANVRLAQMHVTMAQVGANTLSMINPNEPMPGGVDPTRPWLLLGFKSQEDYQEQAWKRFIVPAEVAVSVVEQVSANN